MLKKHLLIAFLIGMFGLNAALAQRDNRSQEKNVVTTVGNDRADSGDVENAFKNVAPDSPHENGLPRFALVGKDNMFYLGIGAQLLGEVVFDQGDEMPSAIYMTPSAITQKTPGNGGNTRFAWQSSSIYLNFVALPSTDNQTGLFFKANFTGSNNFSVYHLYAKYRGLTVGYTASAFTDGAAEPMTIDYEGPNGYPYLTLFTAYWTQNFNKHFSGAIGIDAPSASITTGTGSLTVNQRIPAIPLYLQYARADKSAHIRLSGLVRPLQYRNSVAEKNNSIVGWGLQLSGMTNIIGGLSFQFNGAYGKAFGNYLQDDNGLGLDAVPITNAGELKPVTSMGLTGGLSYQFDCGITANMVYSHLSNWLPEKASVAGDTYRYGDYCAANVIYALNKFISCGVEYDYGHRKSFDGVGLHTNRIQAQFAVTF